MPKDISRIMNEAEISSNCQIIVCIVCISQQFRAFAQDVYGSLTLLLISTHVTLSSSIVVIHARLRDKGDKDRAAGLSQGQVFSFRC